MTTTHDAPHATSGHPPASRRPEPNDPENDIDAKSTAVWVIVSAIVLFLALYFMLPLFDRVMTQERNKKINQRPARELEEVMETERAFLNGELSQSKKTIEQVMQEIAEKK